MDAESIGRAPVDRREDGRSRSHDAGGVRGDAVGDTTAETLTRTAENMEKLAKDRKTRERVREDWLSEVVAADKGYHSNDTMVELQHELGIRTYISEPDRGRRRWKNKPDAQQAVYADRRRIRG